MSQAYERIKKLLEQAGNGTGGIYQGTGGPTQEQIGKSADSAIFRRDEISRNAEIGAQVRQFNKTYTPAQLLPAERTVTVGGKTFTGAQADRVKTLADKYNQTIKNPNATPVELFFAQKNLNDALGRPTPDLQNTIADRYQSQGEAEGDKYIMQAWTDAGAGLSPIPADFVNNIYPIPADFVNNIYPIPGEAGVAARPGAIGKREVDFEKRTKNVTIKNAGCAGLNGEDISREARDNARARGHLV